MTRIEIDNADFFGVGEVDPEDNQDDKQEKGAINASQKVSNNEISA